MMNGVYDDHLEEPNPRSLRYGWFRFKPGCLQVLNRIQCYLAVLFVARALHSGVGDGLIGVIISTIERRFDMSSSQSSWVVGVYDLSALFTVLFFTSLGSRYHRPKVLAIGAGCIGLGCFAFVLPHMVLPTYTPAGVKSDSLCNDTHLDVCVIDEDTPPTSKSFAGTSIALAVLIVARMFMGGGYPCLNIQAVTYLDDFVSKGNFALYSGILGAAGLIGPAMAYVCGSLTLTLYTYYYSVDSSRLGFDSTDSRWVGAWWLGFATAGVVLELVAIMFLGFPRSLPAPIESSQSQANTTITKNGAVKTSEEPKVKTYFWQKKLARSPQFWGVQVFNFFTKLIANGLAAYGPKYIETQFNLDPASAGLVAGAVLVPGGTIGFLAGGAIIKRWKLSCRNILRLMTFTALPVPFLYAIFVFNCKTNQFAGAPVQTQWQTTFELSNASQTCVSACECTDVPFTPVCGADQVNYYSPCHAGCEDVDFDDFGKKVFANCTCLDPSFDLNSTDFTATTGTCFGDKCHLLPAFLGVACLIFILSCAAASMFQVALMRVIVQKERSDALGISAAALCIGGMVGPLFFGWVFDDACDLWDYHCGERGVCLSYNRSKLGNNMFYLSMTVSILSFLGSLVAWRTFKPPEDADEEDGGHSREIVEANGNKGEQGHLTDSPIYKNKEDDAEIEMNGTTTGLLHNSQEDEAATNC